MNGRRQSSFSKTGLFFIGFVLGILVTALIGAGFVGYLIHNPQPVVSRAIDLGATRVINRTVQTIPRDHVVIRQDDINQSVEQLTEAYARGRLTSADIQKLGSRVLNVVSDQKITPDEIDQVINMVDQITR